MNNIKYIGLLILPLFTFLAITALAQKPDIINFSPKIAPTGSEITLFGTGFSNNINDMIVHFGTVNGIITSADENTVVVNVPSGSVYGKLKITLLNNGLSGTSSTPFLPSFSGTTFDENLISSPFNFPSENELYDLAINDFDNDGKIDVITANNNSNLISVFHNNSSPGTIDFTKKTITLNSPTLSVNSGDLDGDGKPDVVISKSGNPGDRIFLLRNTSTPGDISFSTPSFLLVDGNIANKIGIQDLNNDGKFDLIVTNQANSRISIFENSGSPGTISFKPLKTIDIPDPNSSDNNTSGLAVGDLNGDGFPEIICSQYLEKNLYIIPNLSLSGQLEFGDVQILDIPGNIVNVALGDINSDNKPDIVLTKLQQNTLSILINNGTTSNISFSSEKTFIVNDRPWGLDMGDINGDGKVDIVVASINYSARKISVLENQSTQSTLDFNIKYVDTPEITRHLKLGDVDNDGKPDFILTSIESYNVTILRNENCFVPIVSPSGPLSICTGTSVTLSSESGIGITYNWDKDNVSIKSGPENFLDVIDPGIYKVVATSESGSCVMVSNAVIVNLGTGLAPEVPNIYNTGPYCQNESIVLSTDTIANATYNWTGPDYFSSNEQNINIPNASSEKAGIYYLQVSVDECSSNIAESIVQINTLPAFEITSSGPVTDICQGNTVQLFVPQVSGYTYRWNLDGQPVSGQTSHLIDVSQSGTYNVEVTQTSTLCSVFSTNSVDVSVREAPVADFNLPDHGCINADVSFVNTSTFAQGANVTYTWNFGDGSAEVNSNNPVYTYSSSGTYQVMLTIAYSSGSCSNSTTKSLTIHVNPSFSISRTPVSDVCAGDTVFLSTSEAFSSYTWNTNETTRELQITTAGNYTVRVKDVNDCSAEQTVSVDFLESPEVKATADKYDVDPGSTVNLEASGAMIYQWTPGEYLNDSTIATPEATVTKSTEFIVEGENSLGCTDTASVYISINEGNDIFVKPKRLFSPNGDGIDDIWVIDNIETYPESSIVIFNGNGSTVYEASPYQNNWNAVYEGKDLPEGAYFFVIRSPGKDPKTGSVTVIR